VQRVASRCCFSFVLVFALMPSAALANEGGAKPPELLDSVRGHINAQPQFKYVEPEFEEKFGNFAADLRFFHAFSPSFRLGTALATRGSSPRSLFVEFGPGTANELRLQLHTLLAEFSAGPAKVTLGLVDHYLYLPSDFLWDKDIHPLGGKVELELFRLRDNTQLRLISAMFELPSKRFESLPLSEGPYFEQSMALVQAIATHPLGQDANVTHALGFAPAMGVQGRELPYSARSNTREEGNRLSGGYLPLFASAALERVARGHRQALFGEWAGNAAANKQNLAFSMGFTFGTEKLQQLGDWRVQVMHRHLQRDAWLDNLPDVSAGNGRTDARGVEIVHTHMISRHFQSEIDFYRMSLGESDKPYFYVQIKNELKF
jgi:hypothetical protein